MFSTLALVASRVRHTSVTLCSSLLASILISGPALAQVAPAIQSLSSIQRAAESYVQSQLPKGAKRTVKAGELDNRLRLPQCLSDLDVFLPGGFNGGSRVTVGVRCPQGNNLGNGWTLYVPANIETEITTLVLKRSISKDHMITADDVELRSQQVAGTGASTLSSVDELRNQHARRDLAAGTVLMASMLAPDLLVKRGQQVTVVALAGALEVRSQGIALSDAAINDRVRVRNLNSAKVVEGLVDSQSQVKVSL